MACYHRIVEVDSVLLALDSRTLILAVQSKNSSAVALVDTLKNFHSLCNFGLSHRKL